MLGIPIIVRVPNQTIFGKVGGRRPRAVGLRALSVLPNFTLLPERAKKNREIALAGNPALPQVLNQTIRRNDNSAEVITDVVNSLLTR